MTATPMIEPGYLSTVPQRRDFPGNRIGWAFSTPSSLRTVYASSAFAPPWITYVAGELNRLASLPLGWDHAAAKPASAEAVRAVADILEKVLDDGVQPPRFFPLPDGGVQAEWHVGEFETTLEVDAAGRPFVLASIGDDDLIDADVDGVDQLDLSQFREVLAAQAPRMLTYTVFTQW